MQTRRRGGVTDDVGERVIEINDSPNVDILQRLPRRRQQTVRYIESLDAYSHAPAEEEDPNSSHDETASPLYQHHPSARRSSSPPSADEDDDDDQVDGEVDDQGSSDNDPDTAEDESESPSPDQKTLAKKAAKTPTFPPWTLSITWDSIGGLKSHIHALQEMVLLPLLYPEFYAKFALTPPSGRITFYVCKGGGCLSKWVGEAQRQLRVLFEQAKKTEPSIIFLDEIDGLAPVRSAKQDQIHASIVSTLLALMDDRLVVFKRAFPQVYDTPAKLDVDLSQLHVLRGDFHAAQAKIVPAAARSQSAVATPLPPLLAYLFIYLQ
ncbi:hypothetical protein DYB28_005109 [Aphanomyces astaci]|uniref:ATPase AAA-type core domain-containing protein n=1 Tax=Aphanomyces astaci TaxID=112090 RepID=A0A9X8DY71_APHAT|nr:hypothetical protein DYB28_005109 [Aphanomyces astaci]